MKRPVGVTILAVFGMLSGAIALGRQLLWIWEMVYTGEGLPSGAGWLRVPLVLGYVLPCFWGVLWAVIGVGLWKLRNWARRLVILLSALPIGTVPIIFMLKHLDPDFWMPAPWYLLLAVSPYLLFLIYMSSRAVRQAFLR